MVGSSNSATQSLQMAVDETLSVVDMKPPSVGDMNPYLSGTLMVSD